MFQSPVGKFYVAQKGNHLEKSGMHSQGHFRFTLMLGWCSLLTVAVVIMAVVLATGINTKGFSNRTENQSTGAPGSLLAFSQGRKNGTYWQQSQMCFCKNTSLILQDNLVQITVGGFYYIYGQVSVKNVTLNEVKTKIALVANSNIEGKKLRNLIEADRIGPGTMSISSVIQLHKGENVNLTITITNSTALLKGESQTFWGLFLFTKQ
ncbi:hypothetical protein NFI96_011597 [Prochilodus magdalenae]|nr:hypothetical protein NFI96_011597 [Prochilodus magdalenae]